MSLGMHALGVGKRGALTAEKDGKAGGGGGDQGARLQQDGQTPLSCWALGSETPSSNSPTARDPEDPWF